MKNKTSFLGVVGVTFALMATIPIVYYSILLSVQGWVQCADIYSPNAPNFLLVVGMLSLLSVVPLLKIMAGEKVKISKNIYRANLLGVVAIMIFAINALCDVGFKISAFPWGHLCWGSFQAILYTAFTSSLMMLSIFSVIQLKKNARVLELIEIK